MTQVWNKFIIKSKQDLYDSPDGERAPEAFGCPVCWPHVLECTSKSSWAIQCLLPILSHEQKADLGETLGWLQGLELSRHSLLRHSGTLHSFPRKSTPYSVYQDKKVCDTRANSVPLIEGQTSWTIC